MENFSWRSWKVLDFLSVKEWEPWVCSWIYEPLQKTLNLENCSHQSLEKTNSLSVGFCECTFVSGLFCCSCIAVKVALTVLVLLYALLGPGTSWKTHHKANGKSGKPLQVFHMNSVLNDCSNCVDIAPWTSWDVFIFHSSVLATHSSFGFYSCGSLTVRLGRCP